MHTPAKIMQGFDSEISTKAPFNSKSFPKLSPILLVSNEMQQTVKNKLRIKDMTKKYDPKR